MATLAKLIDSDVLFRSDLIVDLILEVDESWFPQLQRILESFRSIADVSNLEVRGLCGGSLPSCREVRVRAYVGVKLADREEVISFVNSSGGELITEILGQETTYLYVRLTAPALQEITDSWALDSLELDWPGVTGDPVLPTQLYLGEYHRFDASATWESAEASGAGLPRALTAASGGFSFFDPDNLEVQVKVLDGCAINGHFWVFVSGLTNLGVEVSVGDSLTRLGRSYTNPLGHLFEPVADTLAFPCERE